MHHLRDGLLPADGRDRAGFCRNPACDGEEFETVELSRRGTVWSYTDAQYQPPPPYVPRTDPYEPFALAAVELAEGITVLGQVADGYGVEDLRVGAEVELVVETARPTRLAIADLALEAGHRAGRGGRPVSANDVAVLGVGMHPWGKWGRPFTEYGVHAARAALADAGVAWQRRRPGGRRRDGPQRLRRLRRRRDVRPGAGLERRPRRDVVRRLRDRRPGPRHRPGPDPGRAVAEVALVVGADTTPKGFLAPNAGERWDDPDWLRFRLLGMTNPAYFALYARRRMDLYGATPEDFAQVKVKNARHGLENPNARYRKEVSVEDVLASAVVSDPLHLLDICATSDGAAAVVVASTEYAQQDRPRPAGAGQRGLAR